jgi:hypothetical protein
VWLSTKTVAVSSRRLRASSAQIGTSRESHEQNATSGTIRHRDRGCRARIARRRIARAGLPTPAAAAAERVLRRPPGGYQFPGGAVTITYPNVGSQTRFTTKTGTHVDTSAETFYPNGTSMKGRITGDITKGSLINLTVTRGSKYPPLLLSGSVLPDNTGHGAYTFENHDVAEWDMDVELNCVPVPDQPQPQSQPENKPVAGPDNDYSG